MGHGVLADDPPIRLDATARLAHDGRSGDALLLAGAASRGAVTARLESAALQLCNSATLRGHGQQDRLTASQRRFEMLLLAAARCPPCPPCPQCAPHHAPQGTGPPKPAQWCAAALPLLPSPRRALGHSGGLACSGSGAGLSQVLSCAARRSSTGGWGAAGLEDAAADVAGHHSHAAAELGGRWQDRRAVACAMLHSQSADSASRRL
jgi:hypothetical protein